MVEEDTCGNWSRANRCDSTFKSGEEGENSL